MKTMLLTLMMVMGLAINYSSAQSACCQPCPPGCCIDKGCTPEDCAKMGCDISKCNASDASTSIKSDKDSKLCCTAATKSIPVKKMCCASEVKTSATTSTAASLFAPCAVPAKAPASTTTSLSLTTSQGRE